MSWMLHTQLFDKWSLHKHFFFKCVQFNPFWFNQSVVSPNFSSFKFKLVYLVPVAKTPNRNKKIIIFLTFCTRYLNGFIINARSQSGELISKHFIIISWWWKINQHEIKCTQMLFFSLYLSVSFVIRNGSYERIRRASQFDAHIFSPIYWKLCRKSIRHFAPIKFKILPVQNTTHQFSLFWLWVFYLIMHAYRSLSLHDPNTFYSISSTEKNSLSMRKNKLLLRGVHICSRAHFHPSLKGITSKSISIKYAKRYNEQIIWFHFVWHYIGH